MLGKVVGSSGLKLLKPKRWADPHITGQQAVPYFSLFNLPSILGEHRPTTCRTLTIKTQLRLCFREPVRATTQIVFAIFSWPVLLVQ